MLESHYSVGPGRELVPTKNLISPQKRMLLCFSYCYRSSHVISLVGLLDLQIKSSKYGLYVFVCFVFFMFCCVFPFLSFFFIASFGIFIVMY